MIKTLVIILAIVITFISTNLRAEDTQGYDFIVCVLSGKGEECTYDLYQSDCNHMGSIPNSTFIVQTDSGEVRLVFGEGFGYCPSGDVEMNSGVMWKYATTEEFLILRSSEGIEFMFVRMYDGSFILVDSSMIILEEE